MVCWSDALPLRQISIAMFAARETRVSFLIFFLSTIHVPSIENRISRKRHKKAITFLSKGPRVKTSQRNNNPQTLHKSFSNHFSFFPSLTDVWPTSTTTESAATAFPSRLRDARSEIQVLSAEDRETWAMTTTACPQCANPEMRYRDVQLRGADEGSTVFYRCPKCDYK